MLTLGSVLACALAGCCGPASMSTCKSSESGLSGAEAIGVIVAVGGAITVATLVEVNHSRHTMKGCSFTGPAGLELQTSDKKIYDLAGQTADIKAGDRLSLHGKKLKDPKNGAAKQTFSVEKTNKDYGPCKLKA